jgi:hypothetical protein
MRYKCNDILQENPELRREKPVPVPTDNFFYKEDTQYVRLKAIMAVTMEACLLRRLSNSAGIKSLRATLPAVIFYWGF